MKHLTLKQIVDTVNHAYDITHVRQYDDDFVNALAECKRTESCIASTQGNISAAKNALTSINMMLANEYAKLDKAQTEKEVNEIISDIRWYAIDRTRTKESFKYYRDTERSLFARNYAAYKVLRNYYQDALDILDRKEAEALKAEEALKAAEEARNADLYTLTRKEAFDLISHITKAVTSNKDEQQFLLDMSHYKK